MPEENSHTIQYLEYSQRAEALVERLNFRIAGFQETLQKGFTRKAVVVTREDPEDGSIAHLKFSRGRSNGPWELSFAWQIKGDDVPKGADFAPLLSAQVSTRLWAIDMFPELLAKLVPLQRKEVERLEAGLTKLEALIGTVRKAGGK